MYFECSDPEGSLTDSSISYPSDSRSMLKLQNIFHEYERSIQKARSRHGHLADKVSQLELEKTELKRFLEEIKDVKSALERNQLELQTEVTNLKFQLKQEQENRRNATMMYNTTREKLKRTEEQQQLEVKERQRVELTLRNLELEMRTLVNNMKQVHLYFQLICTLILCETQRLLAQERSARTLQENLLNSHLRKQQEMEEENRRNIITLTYISQVGDLQVQLEKEASRCSQLEKVNVELKEQLTSLKSLSHSNERLERSKRQLEEEVSSLRRQMESSLMDQSQTEQHRLKAEEKARQEVRQKLEEVNLFLQSQAAAQEALDQIKSANEANLRSQLEQRIRELEGELGRARTTQQDSLNQRDSTRTELDRYRELYTEELRLRKSLAAKLERANNRLEDANAKLLNERHRSKSLITSSIVNGSLGGPSLDLGSPAATYGATLGPLSRSVGLGLPLLSPMTEGQSSRVEDYLARVSISNLHC
uniref:CCDC144C-like coiled-coil domain-containing protein n=1 Tax=Myripristis murdjan TaxID=586833 RepID=A0A667YRA2_9TELE